MNALNKIGGFLLAAVLVIAVIAGLSTGTGQEAGRSVLDATGSVLAACGSWIASVGGNADAAGNLGMALVVGLIMFTALMLLVPKARAGRGFAFSAFASLVVVLLLFQPSLGASLRDAVSAPAIAGEIR